MPRSEVRKLGRPSIRHIHSSGRFDRSPESLEHSARNYFDDADLVTFTEVDSFARKQALMRACQEDYDVVTGINGHADDAAIAFKRDRFELLYRESYENSGQVVYTPEGHQRDLPHTQIVVLHDMQVNRILVVAASHYASNIQSQVLNKRSSYRRVIQWRQSTKNSKRRVNALAEEYNANARLIIADWNINFKKLAFRQLVKAIAPAYRLGWLNTNVVGGTCGRSIFDATIFRGKLKTFGAVLYPDDASSDHRPYVETFIWT